MTDKGLLEGIASLHELTHLHLTGCENLTAQALSTFLHRPSMTSIEILVLQCSNLDDEGLKGIATRCVHLKEFVVCGCCNITDVGINMVIRHCNQLRILKLTGLPYITGDGWLPLVPSHLPHLRELGLHECRNLRVKYVEDLKPAVPELMFTKYME